MAQVKVFYDPNGNTLTVWFGVPKKEYVCEETAEEVVLMKDANDRVIGFELLHYRPADTKLGLAVETVIRTAA